MAHILINQQTVRDYLSKIALDKTSGTINVHILCSNCPPPATTQAQSLFRHSSGFVDDALIQLIPLVHNAFSLECGHP